jgi:S-adenosylmethionine synthetase
MILALEAAPVDPTRSAIEVLERKGVGHPDTLCDAAAEAFSRRLGRAYVDAVGRVLHHNVDKALLVGGSTSARFGGGEWHEPIRLILAGRATGSAPGLEISVDEIGRAAAAEALGVVRHLRDDDVRLEVAVRSGSSDLRTVFERGSEDLPLANDTSIGVGFAPRSPTEELTLALDRRLLGLARSDPASPYGEDTKVMVVRTGDSARITVAIAMIAPLLASEAAYHAAIERVRTEVHDEAVSLGFAAPDVRVNAADGPGSFYLTLSGTSAECGDDGQVGRGNRASGLISPMRPMTIEAYAGKNPRTHVGKLLSLAATDVAEACARHESVRAAECVLVSQIGALVSEPQAASVRLDTPAERIPELQKTVHRAIAEACARLPERWKEILVGDVEGSLRAR